MNKIWKRGVAITYNIVGCLQNEPRSGSRVQCLDNIAFLCILRIIFSDALKWWCILPFLFSDWEQVPLSDESVAFLCTGSTCFLFGHKVFRSLWLAYQSWTEDRAWNEKVLACVWLIWCWFFFQHGADGVLWYWCLKNPGSSNWIWL